MFLKTHKSSLTRGGDNFQKPHKPSAHTDIFYKPHPGAEASSHRKMEPKPQSLEKPKYKSTNEKAIANRRRQGKLGSGGGGMGNRGKLTFN